jgi:hypothetical protein
MRIACELHNFKYIQIANPAHQQKLKVRTRQTKNVLLQFLRGTYFSLINNSTAFSLAALRTPVMVPPALPAAYAKSIDGYFTLSGALNVSEPSLQFQGKIRSQFLIEKKIKKKSPYFRKLRGNYLQRSSLGQVTSEQ